MITGKIIDSVVDSFARQHASEELVSIEDGYILLKHMQDGICMDTYEIPVDDCLTVPGVIFWIMHLKEKTWIDEYLLDSFCRKVFEEVSGHDSTF